MHRLLVAAILALLPVATPGRAGALETLPGLFHIDGVRAGGTLNIRAEPTTAAAVVGEFAATDTDIEVVALDPPGRWGQVNAGEASGWISLDYARSQGGMWYANGVPEALRCFGTEPFWDLAIAGDVLLRGSPDAPERPLAIESIAGDAGSARRTVLARDASGAITLTIAPEACSDGMSDRAFGLAAAVSEAGSPVLAGCCSVAPRN